MSADPVRVKRLELAGAFCLFDNKLRSSGNASIVWGLLNLLIGAAIVAAHGYRGVVSLLFGVILVIAGLYERTVRDSKVIVISAATLALLALWDFFLIGLAVVGKVHLALGGRTLFWALAQGWGAYATWKTYSTYKMLREESDPVIVEQVRTYIGELKRAKPKQSLDLVEFDVNAGFVQGTQHYRLKPIEDLYLVARYKKQFNSLRLEELSFVPRTEVLLSREGEKWMSKKIMAVVQLGPLKLEKVSITVDMAARINPSAGMIALPAT